MPGVRNRTTSFFIAHALILSIATTYATPAFGKRENRSSGAGYPQKKPIVGLPRRDWVRLPALSIPNPENGAGGLVSGSSVSSGNENPDRAKKLPPVGTGAGNSGAKKAPTDALAESDKSKDLMGKSEGGGGGGAAV